MSSDESSAESGDSELLETSLSSGQSSDTESETSERTEAQDLDPSSPAAVLYDAQGNRIHKRQRSGQRIRPPKRRSSLPSAVQGQSMKSQSDSDFSAEDNDEQHASRAQEAEEQQAGFADFDEQFEPTVEPFEGADSGDEGNTAEIGTSEWRQRTSREYTEYGKQRPMIALELLKGFSTLDATEQHCNQPGCNRSIVIKCKECGYLCAACDKEQHPLAHFHHRFRLQEGQFWDAVGPDVEIGVNGSSVRVAKLFSTAPHHACSLCHKSNWGPAQMTHEPLAVVTLEGRFDFFKAAHSCLTEGCRSTVLQGPAAALQLGYWPGTVQKMRTMYDVGLFRHWMKASKAMPGSSLSAFVSVLQETGKEQGREGSINRHTMSLAFGEFKFAQHELTFLSDHRSGLHCPACYKGPHSVMIDGNHKLYRWDREYEVFRECYYDELLLYKDTSVQQSLVALDLQLGTRRLDVACGTGQWKAARDSKSAIRGQAETGSVLCGCRHQFAMKGVNMKYSGERYGYAYFLDHNFLQPAGTKFIWQDIICKYWPWREKAREQMHHGDGGLIRPALNLMHGKLHSWECQALFGGQWQEGAAAGSGEDMEMLFSYLSRHGLITKLMGPARRAEAITEAALFWNAGKVESLAEALVERSEDCFERLIAAEAALEMVCQEVVGVEAGEVPLETFEDWKIGVQSAAQKKLDKVHRNQSDSVEYFALHTELEVAQELAPLVESTAFGDSILCSEKVQEVQTLAAELTRERAGKEKRLQDLERKVLGPDSGRERDEESRERLLSEAREQLAEQCIEQTQIDIEASLHALEKYKLRVSKEADSSKMRSALRKKEGEVKKHIVALVRRYNVVVEKGKQSRALADAEKLLAGEELPWAFEGCGQADLRVGLLIHRTVAFKKRLSWN